MKNLRVILRPGSGMILLAFAAFISLALPDGLIGVAWPSIRGNFSRPIDSLGLLLLASTTGYLISSFFSGYILSKTGIGLLLSLSCGITGAAMIGYTMVPEWWMMIPLAAAAGLGGGAIDAGLNTYAASNFSERIMQWLHASFGIGITMGPFIMTIGLNSFNTWRWGYIVVGSMQIALAVCFAMTNSIWNINKGKEDSPGNAKVKNISLLRTLSSLRVWLSILLFFVYSGIEASLGYWSYTLLTESRGIAPESAGFWVGGYWASFTVGRILAGIFTRRISMDRLIRISLLTALVGSILLIWNPFILSSLMGVVIIGFAIAPIFPGMVSLTHRRVSPEFVVNTIGMQISAAGLGFSVIPALTGVAARQISIEVVTYVILGSILLLYYLYRFSMKR